MLFQSPRLNFRKIGDDDFAIIATIMRDEGVQKVWGHYFTNDEVKEWISQRKNCYEKNGIDYLLVSEKLSQKVVGLVGLLKKVTNGKDAWEIGYILLNEYYGNGYATEGAKVMADYAFHVLKAPKVICEIRPMNKPSIAVAKRLGMQEKGIFIKHYHNIEMPHLIFELSNHETVFMEKGKMNKPLSEMTLQELWQLFPIQLTEHQTYWKGWYQDEQIFLASFLPKEARINHIGSTAIKGIWAKPIIDILVEVSFTKHETIKELLLAKGYVCMAKIGNHIDLNKGYTPDGFAERVFHLHLRDYGDHNELYFRDYLKEHPEVAKEYEKLKLALWKLYEHDRDGYTERKTDFVQKILRIALEQYGKEKYQ